MNTPTDQELLKEILAEQDEEVVYKSVSIDLQESAERGLEQSSSQKGHNLSESRNLFGKLEPSIWSPFDKTFLDLHVMLNEDVNCEDAFEFLKETLKTPEGFKNYKESPQEKKIVGYHFADTRPGCYRVEIFEQNEQFGVNCTRLQGDAFAVSGLWDLVKRALIDQQFVTPDDIEMGETDDEDFFYSDDEEDAVFDMDSFKYLDFSRDRPFVNRMIDDIEDKNVGTHSLMLLAFNLQSDRNKEFLSENYRQEIFNKTVLRLSDKDSVDLPVARCSASIIEQLIQYNSFDVRAGQMKTIVQTILNWSQETGEAVTPTSSEETAYRLTNVLEELTSAMSGNYDMEGDLQKILEETDFDTVKDRLGGLLVASN